MQHLVKEIPQTIKQRVSNEKSQHILIPAVVCFQGKKTNIHSNPVLKSITTSVTSRPRAVKQKPDDGVCSHARVGMPMLREIFHE